MSERRSEVRSRLATMNELSDVLGAMRGIAAARIQQGERAREAARTYAAGIGTALASLAAEAPPAASRTETVDLVVALCTERGFVGSLNERVLDGARAAGGRTLVVVGARGQALAQERGWPSVDGGGMAAHLGGLGDLADRLAALLARRADLASGALTAEVVYPRRTADGVRIERRGLLPIDLGSLSRPAPGSPFPPITLLPRQTLIADIAGEYVHARLYEMAAESFAAANAASLEVLQAAHAHLEEMLVQLRRTENILRQEEITAEVLEVITGRMRDA